MSITSTLYRTFHGLFIFEWWYYVLVSWKAPEWVLFSCVSYRCHLCFTHTNWPFFTTIFMNSKHKKTLGNTGFPRVLIFFWYSVELSLGQLWMPVKWGFSDMRAAYVMQTHSIPEQLSTSLHGQVSGMVPGHCLRLYFYWKSFFHYSQTHNIKGSWS